MEADSRIPDFERFWPFYVSQHGRPGTRALHFAGLTLALLLIVTSLAAGRPSLLLWALLAGYGFAWVGHFFIEKNRPATFQYPLSLATSRCTDSCGEAGWARKWSGYVRGAKPCHPEDRSEPCHPEQRSCHPEQSQGEPGHRCRNPGWKDLDRPLSPSLLISLLHERVPQSPARSPR